MPPSMLEDNGDMRITRQSNPGKKKTLQVEMCDFKCTRCHHLMVVQCCLLQWPSSERVEDFVLS